MSRKNPLPESFDHAFDGLVSAFKREPNFRVHTTIAVLVLISAAVLQVSRIEWLILLFTIFFVLILELLNTVLEALVDLVQPTFHEKAKIAKDVAAAGVLLGAIISIFVGALIFIPKLISL